MKLFDQARLFTRVIKQEVRVYQCVLRDKRTPWYAKAVLGLAIGYLLMPFDLIPDFIPVLGQLDDLLIVPGLVWLALKLIPAEIVADCRRSVSDESLPP
ncbi:MAG: YkvA family protein [Chloroflexota bacterium]